MAMAMLVLYNRTRRMESTGWFLLVGLIYEGRIIGYNDAANNSLKSKNIQFSRFSSLGC
jgi:hypothetical protein